MRYRPQSFFSLVLLGLVLGGLPLVAALVHAAASVNRLADRSAAVVNDAVSVTQSTRLLLVHIGTLERYARQYADEPQEKLLQGYNTTRPKFLAATRALEKLPLNTEQRALLVALQDEERHLHAGMLFPRGVTPNTTTLAEKAQALRAESQYFVEQAVQSLKNRARSAERVLVWQAVAVIPLATALMLIAAYLISRPVRQIDAAIKVMGAGDFSQPVRVQGAHDVAYLGQRLDWLRVRLAELESEKRKFLRHVSHELKTPLAAIREGADLLDEQALGPLNQEQREIAQILKQNGLRLQALIENLLRFNTPSVQRLSPVALDALIADVAALHRPVLRKKQVRLVRELAPVTVRGDAEQLRIVIDNLLSNAAKFAPAHSTLTLRLQQRQGEAVFDVIDQGPGISPAERVRVFEPFYQGAQRGKGAMGGNGLGLAIARELVNAHGGGIEALDCASGAHLRVALPALSGELREAS